MSLVGWDQVINSEQEKTEIVVAKGDTCSLNHLDISLILLWLTLFRLIILIRMV